MVGDLMVFDGGVCCGQTCQTRSWTNDEAKLMLTLHVMFYRLRFDRFPAR